MSKDRAARSRANKQADLLSEVSDIVQASDLTAAEKVGVLEIVKTSYMIAATSK